MKTVKGKTFHGATVTIDGTEFVGCTLTNCDLVHSGGAFGWVETDITDCTITLRGASAMTVSFLESFALIDPAPKGKWNLVTLEFPEKELTEWKDSTFDKKKTN